MVNERKGKSVERRMLTELNDWIVLNASIYKPLQVVTESVIHEPEKLSTCLGIGTIILNFGFKPANIQGVVNVKDDALRTESPCIWATGSDNDSDRSHRAMGNRISVCGGSSEVVTCLSGIWLWRNSDLLFHLYCREQDEKQSTFPKENRLSDELRRGESPISARSGPRISDSCAIYEDLPFRTAHRFRDVWWASRRGCVNGMFIQLESSTSGPDLRTQDPGWYFEGIDLNSKWLSPDRTGLTGFTNASCLCSRRCQIPRVITTIRGHKNKVNSNFEVLKSRCFWKRSQTKFKKVWLKRLDPIRTKTVMNETAQFKINLLRGSGVL